MKVLIGLAILAGVLYLYVNIKGTRVLDKIQNELKELREGEHYRRMVLVVHNDREYFARVRRWNIPEVPENAELWCVEGPNPDGWTGYFNWPHKDIKFL